VADGEVPAFAVVFPIIKRRVGWALKNHSSVAEVDAAVAQGRGSLGGIILDPHRQSSCEITGRNGGEPSTPAAREQWTGGCR
jgi:hypothetical protein